jgi:hypothetical protein
VAEIVINNGSEIDDQDAIIVGCEVLDVCCVMDPHFDRRRQIELTGRMIPGVISLKPPDVMG